MNKKQTSLIITLVVFFFIFLIGAIITIQYNKGFNISNFVKQEEKEIDKNDWENIKSTNKDEVLKVRWSEKYGMRRIEYCKVVFYNRKDGLIKLVAPWLDMIIVKANTYDIEYKRISIDSIPKGYNE